MSKRIEIGGSGVYLDELRPEQNPAYSPNLYRWLRLRGNVAHVLRVARDKMGMLHLCLWSGPYPGTTLLNRALCVGGKAEIVSMYLFGDLTPIDDFWPRYRDIGRCAIDTEHKERFIGNETRWEYNEDKTERKCLWCGNATQRPVRTERVVVDEEWETQC